MYVIEGVKNQHVGSAFITAACISRSYKVESTRKTATLFLDVDRSLEVVTPADVVACVLTAGRLLDLAIEVKNPQSIKDVYDGFRSAMEGAGAGEGPDDLWAALLAGASVSHSSKVETIRETVAIWSEYRDKLPSMDPLDSIAVILGRGRIIDLAATSLSFAEILSTVENLKTEVVASGAREAGWREIAAAFIASAYITVTSKVETLKDIVGTWRKVTEMVKVDDELDFVCAILTSGNVTDLDAVSILTPFSIPDQMAKLREELRSGGFDSGA